MFVTLLLIIALVILALSHMRREPTKAMAAVRNGFIAFNGVILVAVVLVSILIWMGTPTPTFAQPLLQTGGPTTTGNSDLAGSISALAAAIAVGLAAVGAGIAVGFSGSAAISAMAEKPEVFGRTLIFVGLAEGIAIYGILIAFMILTS